MSKLRIDQILSKYGYCSRREAADWVKAGRVRRNDGQSFRETAERTCVADVLIDGQEVEYHDRLAVLFYKPAGYACSHDPAESPLIYDLFPRQWMRRNPVPVSVGRLDRDTTGLLLITDDGDLVHYLTSPKHDIEKTYEVTVSAPFPEGLAELFASGTLTLHGEKKPCLPARLEITGPLTARLFLREGKYHQVRRMLASQGCPVTALHRSAIGALTLEDLGVGEWKDCRRLLPLLQLPD